jgi:hypothetical protein
MMLVDREETRTLARERPAFPGRCKIFQKITLNLGFSPLTLSLYT